MRPERNDNANQNVITRGLEVEKVVDEVLDYLDVVAEPGTKDEHPPRVLHRVELEVVHAVPAKQVMPQQRDHPLHDARVPVDSHHVSIMSVSRLRLCLLTCPA